MIWLLFIALCAACVAPFVLERRKPDMDDEVRAFAPGAFADLSDGKTHFQWHGPSEGPVLVCVHGLTTPSYVWDSLLPGLTEAGLRVLTYDLYGRGWSDRPGGTQTRSFFIRQLRDLLHHEGISGPITVLGYSMGGGIATIFAAEEPERVARLVLLAPAGLTHRPTRLSELMRRSGPIGSWLMLTLGGSELRRIARATPASDSFTTRLAAEVDWRGYLPAVLSSQRHLLGEDLRDEHQILAKMNVPTLAIWGEVDTVIPIQAMGYLSQANRNAKQASLPRAGHALLITHPSEVLESLADLLQA